METIHWVNLIVIVNIVLCLIGIVWLRRSVGDSEKVLEQLIQARKRKSESRDEK